jgi:hypothetical protein
LADETSPGVDLAEGDAGLAALDLAAPEPLCEPALEECWAFDELPREAAEPGCALASCWDCATAPRALVIARVRPATPGAEPW